jgi:hypothetical protein
MAGSRQKGENLFQFRVEERSKVIINCKSGDSSQLDESYLCEEKADESNVYCSMMIEEADTDLCRPKAALTPDATPHERKGNIQKKNRRGIIQTGCSHKLTNDKTSTPFNWYVSNDSENTNKGPNGFKSSSQVDSNDFHSSRVLSPVTPASKCEWQWRDTDLLASPETARRASHDDDGYLSVGMQFSEHLMSNDGIVIPKRDLSGSVSLSGDDSDTSDSEADRIESGIAGSDLKAGSSCQISELPSYIVSRPVPGKRPESRPSKSSAHVQNRFNLKGRVSFIASPVAAGAVVACSSSSSVAAGNEVKPTSAAHEPDCEVLSVALGTIDPATFNSSVARGVVASSRRRHKQKFSDVEPSDSDEGDDVEQLNSDDESSRLISLFDDPVLDVDEAPFKLDNCINKPAEIGQSQQEIEDDQLRESRVENKDTYEDDEESINFRRQTSEMKGMRSGHSSKCYMIDSEETERPNSADVHFSWNLKSPNAKQTKIYKHERVDDCQRVKSNRKQGKSPKSPTDHLRKGRNDRVLKSAEKNKKNGKVLLCEKSKVVKDRGEASKQKKTCASTPSGSKGKRGVTSADEDAFKEFKSMYYA